MKLIRRESTLHIRKRVPRRYSRVEPREFVWLSLHTDSELVAEQKAPRIWAEMIEAWEAKMAGAGAEANDRMAAAKNLAAARGYRYLQVNDVAKLPLGELMTRVESVVRRNGKIDMQEADAVLGIAPAPQIKVTDALGLFWKLSRDRTIGKSRDQIRRWENPRKKAVANFIKIAGNLPIVDITTADIMAFRSWLADLMVDGTLSAGSANKDLIHLIATVKDVARANDLVLQFNRERVLFKEGKQNVRPPFSKTWIKDKLLGPGALDALNPQARGILLGMINTGYRPSEGAMLTAAQIRLDCEIPHISIEAVGRTLKTDHSERVIPLWGISLTAFQEFPKGFPRYADKPGLSDTINKFLRENGLLETDEHSLYCLRHSFEDRMLAAGVDERIRADLMGHQIKRERYGAGADLVHLQSVIQKIAL